MAVYFITGKLGCGKTLCAVGKIRDYLQQGRRVATNLDINLAAISGRESKQTILRVPDKPSIYDLNAIGEGCIESDESQYGLLVLDELGTWFNSRNWRDKERLDVIDWFLHARKKHWDIFFIVQNINSLDDQLVSALCEHLVICKRTDRLTIPIIGPILKTLGFQKVLPKIHVAKVHYGQTTASLAVDRWWYRGKDLYSSYNTDQIFSDVSHAVHSLLPAYYLNNVAIVNNLKRRIDLLTPDLKTGQPPADRFLKMGAAVVFTLGMFLLSARSYSKYNEITAEPDVITSVKLQPVDATPKKDASQLANLPVLSVKHDDEIKKITQDAMVTASSYYEFEGRVNAVLHVTRQAQTYDFTLEDARAMGYAFVRKGGYAVVQGNGYNFTFKIPG